MLFELSNASANYQKFINKIIAKKFDILVIVYINDILIYTKNLG